jgi:hypothetical protein
MSLRFQGTTYSPMCWKVAAAAVVLIAVASAAGIAEQASETPTGHRTLKLEGWTVHVDERLFEDDQSPLRETAIHLLSAKLLEIRLVVPSDPLARLQEVPIWLDLSCGDLQQLQYHPSRDWLREHGHPTELARCVHIPQATRFVDRDFIQCQPSCVMHELAHAYHDRQFGFDDKKIAAAHARFREREETRSVLHFSGDRREHYGRTNPMEFFAEATEAYFGTNDFYPFVRGELRQDDPETFALLNEVWADRTDDETVGKTPSRER